MTKCVFRCGCGLAFLTLPTADGRRSGCYSTFSGFASFDISQCMTRNDIGPSHPSNPLCVSRIRRTAVLLNDDRDHQHRYVKKLLSGLQQTGTTRELSTKYEGHTHNKNVSHTSYTTRTGMGAGSRPAPMCNKTMYK